ncbi:hypothetical protein N7465_012006 [Penicillium sp. CMV-2018d]|nr:hypothetical protein N7465_012006 [Penicillium sp. CMV-2018d]
MTLTDTNHHIYIIHLTSNSQMIIEGIRLIDNRPEKTISSLPVYNNPKIQQILIKYKGLFYTELLTTLPLEQNIVYKIYIDTNNPININIYRLSAKKLDE